MYIPGYFKVTDEAVAEQFIRENSFATIVSCGEQYPSATHIPVELELNENGEKVLWGHVSKANPQWRSFQQHPNVRVIYLSPLQHYISSSWYDHPNAPTWNYVSVHVTGALTLVDEDKAWESVRRLVAKYEKDSANPISLDTLPPAVQSEMKGLVAFEIKIDSIYAAFKLSQNRDDKNFHLILDALRAKGDATANLLAALMQQVREQSR